MRIPKQESKKIIFNKKQLTRKWNLILILIPNYDIFYVFPNSLVQVNNYIL